MSWFSDDMYTELVNCTEDESNYIECKASSELVGTTLKLIMTPYVEDYDMVVGSVVDSIDNYEVVLSYKNVKGAGIMVTPPDFDASLL